MIYMLILEEKNSISIGYYKSSTNEHHRCQVFQGDMVMVCTIPKWFPKRTIKEFHAQSASSSKVLKKINGYIFVLDFPLDLGINQNLQCGRFSALQRTTYSSRHKCISIISSFKRISRRLYCFYITATFTRPSFTIIVIPNQYEGRSESHLG